MVEVPPLNYLGTLQPLSFLKKRHCATRQQGDLVPCVSAPGSNANPPAFRDEHAPSRSHGLHSVEEPIPLPVSTIRTIGQYRQLLESAGLKVTGVFESGDDVSPSVIEAMVA